MNTYQFKSMTELMLRYNEIFKLIEENEGEVTDEITEELNAIEEDYELLAYDILLINEGLENEINRRKNEIERLKTLNNSDARNIDNFRKMLTDIVKNKGRINRSGNNTLKVADHNLSVTKSKSVSVSEDFKDERYIDYKLNIKLSAQHKERIDKYITTNLGIEDSFVGIVDKKSLKEDLENGIEVEGAEIILKDQLNIR